MKFEEIEGNLIELALDDTFDVIAHGCNCFCVQKKGLAVDMVKHFKTDTFEMERYGWRGDINKLGTIDFGVFALIDKKAVTIKAAPVHLKDVHLVVANCYTQYMWARHNNQKPLDYEAITLCMRKLNKMFSGKHIGLPRIGCGLAGGDWSIVSKIMYSEFQDCNVTIVNYNHDKL